MRTFWEKEAGSIHRRVKTEEFERSEEAAPAGPLPRDRIVPSKNLNDTTVQKPSPLKFQVFHPSGNWYGVSISDDVRLMDEPAMTMRERTDPPLLSYTFCSALGRLK
ncbi:unnamed protein product [Leptosia nina]|uniref:Uncharacterized protein n=1 Tax=Leptosia nina TaxID=320188 RepID=A0AAV1JA10_9NEOP